MTATTRIVFAVVVFFVAAITFAILYNVFSLVLQTTGSSVADRQGSTDPDAASPGRAVAQSSPVATPPATAPRPPGPTDDEIRAAVTAMLKAGLSPSELCNVAGVFSNKGARTVKVDALEITRRGIFNAEQKYLKVVVRASGTFETSLEDWDFGRTPQQQLVWCPCSFNGETEYSIQQDGYGGWRVAPFFGMPLRGLNPKFKGIPKHAQTR